MNREILFRAFCETDNGNEMVEFAPMDFDNGLWFQALGTHIDKHISPPMQFTGFKDRNGTKIFEGDYVKEDFTQDSNYRSIGLVEFYEGSFGSRNGHGRFRIPALFSGKAIEGMNLNYYEVMGNKYENPELSPTKEPLL